MNPNIVTQDFSQNFFSKRKKDKEKFNFGITSTYIILLSIITVFLLYFVWSLNANATNGYTIRDLEERKKELLMEKQKLDVKISELESLNYIKNNFNMDNTEEVIDPDYLVIKDNVQYVYNY